MLQVIHQTLPSPLHKKGLGTKLPLVWVGTNSRNGAEWNGRELWSKTRNSSGTLKFDQDGQKLAARVLRLCLLQPDGQVSGSTYTGIFRLVEGSLLTQLQWQITRVYNSIIIILQLPVLKMHMYCMQ